MKPDFEPAWNNRGFAYEKKGNRTGAIADYTQAIKLNSADALVYLNRGLAYAALSDSNSAIADLKKVVALNQDPNLTKQAQTKLTALGVK